MKLLLALRFDGGRQAFIDAMSGKVTGMIARGDARRGALDVRVEGKELEIASVLDTEKRVSALVSLWEPASVDEALELTLPPGVELVGGYRVEEVIQKNYEVTWPSGEASPGVKCVCFVRRRPDLTRQAYSEHWRLRHGPLAVKHQPGFWHYVQNHVIERLGDTAPDVDGIGELHYRNAGEIHTASFDSEEGRRLILEDTERFMDHTTSTTLPTKEYLLPSSSPTS